MVHLIPCIEAMDAKEFAELYIDHVFKYHGLSKVTISDRGATFNNQFWIEVRKLIGVDPAFSTAYHPQSDGQTERTNQIVEEMLRHYILPTQEDWPRHLAFAEFAINNSWQESIQSTPFLVNYGQSPITPVLHKLPRPCLSPSAESFAKKWEHEVKHAQECMRVAQDRQQRYANKRRRDVTFSVGDSVLLSTKNLRNAPGRARRFLPRYVGPFKVTGKLGEAAYRLELPPTMSRLHPVFHVSLLKKYTGSQGFHPPPVMEWLEDAPHYEVHSLLSHRQVRFKKRMEYLVKWTGYDDTYNTWEPEAMLAGAPQILSRLQLQPDVDGSVMLTVHQYGKPSSAVGSRPVELLCMRVSLSDAVGMLNKQMPEYIKHHRLAHHQLQVFREHREAVKAGKDGKVVISCDWSEKLTVERSVEIMSEHWHAAQIGILVACAYFKNKEGAYYEHTVYVMTDGKEQSAAITQAAVNQVVCYLLAEHDMDMRQLYMWSDGCAGQFKGAPAMRQHWGMAQRFSVPVWWSYGATAHFKGRHDSEGGVVKQWLRGEILADRVGKCNALGFVQHCNAYHKAATAAGPSKAHRARASVGHRWCLELSTQEKRDDKHWDDECLTLLCSFAPDSVMQLCTLGKKLSVKMLNEYCKAVGLCVPVGTLRADLRYMVLQHLNEQADITKAHRAERNRSRAWQTAGHRRVPAARARRRKRNAKPSLPALPPSPTFAFGPSPSPPPPPPSPVVTTPLLPPPPSPPSLPTARPPSPAAAAAQTTITVGAATFLLYAQPRVGCHLDDFCNSSCSLGPATCWPASFTGPAELEAVHNLAWQVPGSQVYIGSQALLTASSTTPRISFLDGASTAYFSLVDPSPDFDAAWAAGPELQITPTTIAASTLTFTLGAALATSLLHSVVCSLGAATLGSSALTATVTATNALYSAASTTSLLSLGTSGGAASLLHLSQEGVWGLDAPALGSTALNEAINRLVVMGAALVGLLLLQYLLLLAWSALFKCVDSGLG
ncbi:hypothetical protein QJQ45_007734 [Haematococcus lacustris]|nr:hypothetical protein QJQ45_007734 [Haematococcus lacustris]